MISDILTKAHSMSEATWRRHSNPWSVWTRFAILPALSLAIWSRIWIGWWAAIPTVVLLFWTWLNPRAFPAPRSTDNWATRAVLGERIWTGATRESLPLNHRNVPHIVSVLTGMGLPYVVWGLVALHEWSLFLGLFLVIVGKLWFLDRMVWLYEDSQRAANRAR